MIGIVGAGIGGLALHHALHRAGRECVTFEAAAEPGGVVRSRSVDGTVVELGPQRLRSTPPIRRLVDDLDLGDDLVRAPRRPLYVYREGALCRAPLSPRSALTTDLLSWRGKLRVLAEPLTRGVRAGETVDGALRRKFGDEATDHLLGPLYAGLYASDPAEMPVEHSLAKALDHAGVSRSVLATAVRKLAAGYERPPIVSFRDGLQQLPRELYRTDADAIHLETPVDLLRDGGDGYVLEAGGRSVAVDEVVLTTPAPVAASLLQPVAPDAARRLERLTYNPLAVVQLRSEWHLPGKGFKVPAPAGAATLGVTATGPLFDRGGVYAAYLGGRRDPSLVDRPDDELGELAAREFEALTGQAARPLDVARVRPGMPAYDHTWAALQGLSLPDGVHLCTNYVARAGVPGRVGQARRLAEELA